MCSYISNKAFVKNTFKRAVCYLRILQTESKFQFKVLVEIGHLTLVKL